MKLDLSGQEALRVQSVKLKRRVEVGDARGQLASQPLFSSLSALFVNDVILDGTVLGNCNLALFY